MFYSCDNPKEKNNIFKSYMLLVKKKSMAVCTVYLTFETKLCDMRSRNLTFFTKWMSLSKKLFTYKKQNVFKQACALNLLTYIFLWIECESPSMFLFITDQQVNPDTLWLRMYVCHKANLMIIAASQLYLCILRVRVALGWSMSVWWYFLYTVA